MEKDFNIFGEFETVESNYLKSLEDETIQPGDEGDDDLDEILKAKEKEAKAAANENDQDDEEDDSEEDKSEKPKEDVEEEDESEEEPEGSGSYSFKALANVLADEGVIDYEDSEDEDDSIDVISKAVFNTAKNMLDEYKDSLPDEGKKFLTYLEKGGDPSKYIEKISTNSILDLDLENTDNQKKILTEFLKKSDFDEDEIKEMIEDYEDGLILEKQAKIALKKLEKYYDKEKESLVKAQEEAQLEKQKQFKLQVKQLEDTIEDSDSIAGIKVTKAEKKALKSYLLDVDKDGLTQWTRDLKDGGTKTQLALAYLQMKKFDFQKIAKVATTEVTKKYKGIFDGKDNTVKGRSKNVKTDSAGDFSSFKQLLV